MSVNIHQRLLAEGHKYTNKLQFLDDVFEYCYYKFEEYPTYLQLVLHFHDDQYRPVFRRYYWKTIADYYAYEEELVKAAEEAERQYRERERQRIIAEYFPFMNMKTKPLKPFSHPNS